MSKYEIMVVVDGSLNEQDAKKSFTEIKKYLSKIKKIDVTEMGHRKLAYLIDKKANGYYYVMNFECSEPSIIAEFRRLILLNKTVLRHLIINVEKNYAYKATVNPKKVKKSQYRKDTYEKILAKISEEKDKITKLKDDTPVKLTDI